jgi:putative isomerase
MQGYLTWGSDGDNQPANLDDDSRGTRQGAILESGLDNSPMYDGDNL